MASAMSGSRFQLPSESLPCASAVERIVARMYDWYLSGICCPSVPFTTVAAPKLAPGRI